MRLIGLKKTGIAVAVLAAVAACMDTPPTGPGVEPHQPAAVTPRLDAPLAIISCTASTSAKSVTCVNPSASVSASGDRRDAVLVGGQNQFVALTSSNVGYNSGTGQFTFDVTVQNLIPQPLATTDGTSAQANGVRVFFSSGPTVTGGTGVASVIPDGFGTFTAAGQAYYQYDGANLGADGILSQNEASLSKPWTLIVPATATTFSFLLYVWADVQFPNGYIDVTPVRDTLVTGDTQALTATVRNYLGEVVPSATVTWGTANGTIATVDVDGTVTGMAAGGVNITATSGLRSGLARINVCPNIAVGATYVATMPAASELCLAGGASGAEYTYSPINLSTSSALSLTVTASGIQAVTGPPTPNMIPSGTVLTTSGIGATEALGFETTVASDVPFMMPDPQLMRRLMSDPNKRIKRRASGADRGISYSVASAVPVVGDSLNINTNSACSGSPSVRRGVVRTVSQHLIIVGDTANPAGGFTTAQYDSIALEFDSVAWGVDSANFGNPTDNDGNGHVIAFYTRAVNELSPPASSSVVLGFFASKDIFDATDCSNSNMGEMFYMLVPDPTGAVNSNVRTVSFVRGSTVGTLGHEFQHLINGWRRAYVTGASFFEEGWLNEGLSHIAEELMFYRTSVGLAPRGNIQLSTLTTGPNASRRVAAFNTYANQNFGRLKSWLQRPDTAGAFKPNANSLAVRGAIWSFLRYSADRVNGNDETFFFNLVNSNLEGKSNVQNAIGGGSPNDWLRDFTAAMYADDNAFSVATEYQNPSWNFRSVYGGLGGFALLPRPLTNGVGLTLSYSQGGGTAYTRFGIPTAAFAGVTALSGGTPPVSPYALIVTRTK
jgi:hypothetical protein